MIEIVSSNEWLFEALQSIAGLQKHVTMLSRSDKKNDGSVQVIILDECNDVPSSLKKRNAVKYLTVGKSSECDVVKPFHISDLVRIIEKYLCGVYRVSQDVVFDYRKRALIDNADNKSIILTEKESEMLRHLITKESGVSKAEMLKCIWKYQPETETTTIETHIHRLKQKLSTMKLHNLFFHCDGVYKITCVHNH